MCDSLLSTGPNPSAFAPQGPAFSGSLQAHAMGNLMVEPVLPASLPPFGATTLAPLLIAHRGLSARYPENTLAAFRAAADEGYTAVEFDVQLSRDGALVVFHDDTLLRITGHPGRIADLTWAELSLFDAGIWKSTEFFGERIPRLEELVPYWHGTRLVNIEVKASGPDDLATVEAVADFVRRHDAPFLISSFQPEVLRRFRRLDSVTPVGVLFDGPQGWNEALALAADIGATGVNPDVAAAIDPVEVARARTLGYEVHVHTVNDAAMAHRLSAHGVTGLFTDDVAALRAAMAVADAARIPDDTAPELRSVPPARLLPQA